MAKSWPGGKTTLYLIAPQRQPPAALTGNFSCMVLFIFDSGENCLRVYLLLEKQKKKSVFEDDAQLYEYVKLLMGIPPQMLVIHLAGVAYVDDVFSNLVRGNNAPYHAVTGFRGTTRKVLFISSCS